MIKTDEAGYPLEKTELQSNHQLSDYGEFLGYHFQDKYHSFGSLFTAI